MKRLVTFCTGFVVAAFLLALTTSAFASQDRASAGAPSSSGGAATTSSSGGGSVSNGGGSSGGGGSTFSGGVRGERGERGAGREHARGGATGGSGVAMPRGGGENYRGGSVGSGGGSRGAIGETSVGRSGVRNNGSAAGRTDDAREKNDGVPHYSRPRDGQPPTGTAVPRSPDSSVPTRGGGYVVVPGGYYGGFYDPWFSGGIGYYGGYYDPFYDPWYGGYPSYPQSSYSSDDEGSLKLKIKPKNAEVFVDGYYVGSVDEFDGLFQRLHIESGTHRIEVRANGYETLTFDVRITPDHTTTYQGEMKRVQ